MKRMLCFFLIFVCCFSFSACSKEANNNEPQNTTSKPSNFTSNTTTSTPNSSLNSLTETPNDDEEDATSKVLENTSKTPSKNTSSINSTINIDNNTSSEPIKVTPQKPIVVVDKNHASDTKDKVHISDNGNQTTDKGNVVVEDIVTDETIQQPETPDIKDEVNVVTKHNEIHPTAYYQYSQLTSAEKKVYNAINNSILKGENVVDISSEAVKYNAVSKLIQKFFSDQPQYFYVSRFTSITYDPNTNKVYNILLYYTDGKTTDKFNEDGNKLETMANRETITKKIENFNNKTEDVVNQIPTSIKDYEKEKIIHDYVVKNVSYDNVSASKNYMVNDTLPHAFDIYGALCEGKAVCEGYSKLFQYLCYKTGINSTQVVGTSMNINHMWNTTNVDGEWYHVDTTWNDSCSTEVPYYGYYNISTNTVLEDHNIDNRTILVPTCNSDKHSFYNDYALIIEDITKAPRNIEKSIQYIVDGESVYLVVYFQISDLTQDYLRKYIFNYDSYFKKYLQNNNIALELEHRYKVLSSYMYIPIKR